MLYALLLAFRHCFQKSLIPVIIGPRITLIIIVTLHVSCSTYQKNIRNIVSMIHVCASSYNKEIMRTMKNNRMCVCYSFEVSFPAHFIDFACFRIPLMSLWHPTLLFIGEWRSRGKTWSMFIIHAVNSRVLLSLRSALVMTAHQNFWENREYPRCMTQSTGSDLCIIQRGHPLSGDVTKNGIRARILIWPNDSKLARSTANHCHVAHPGMLTIDFNICPKMIAVSFHKCRVKIIRVALYVT